MKIKIIEENIGNPNLALQAWQLSRPADKTTSLKDIGKIDAPVNDFPTLVLNIKSMIIEREVIASMHDVTMWAQTSRVENVLNFKVENETKFTKNQRFRMNQAKHFGHSQDAYRMFLPVIALTEYTIKISLRSIVKLYHVFEKLMLDGAKDALFILIEKYDLLTLVKSATKINLLPSIYKKENGMVGDTIVITKTIPFSLRTHLIRHMLLSIRDNFSSIIISKQYKNMCLGDQVNVQISGSIDIWKSVYSKRSCWLAHHDLWKNILVELNYYTPLNKNMLPCSEGSCPYAPDAEQRYKGIDPGIPCPKFLNMHINKKIDSSIKKEIENYVVKNNLPVFWLETIGEMK